MRCKAMDMINWNVRQVMHGSQFRASVNNARITLIGKINSLFRFPSLTSSAYTLFSNVQIGLLTFRPNNLLNRFIVNDNAIFY